MKNYCRKCKRYEQCKNLCATCEEYVNQDYVPIEEGLVNIHLENYDRYDPFGHDIWITPNFESSSILKATIILLWKDGKSMREIAELVPSTFQYAAQVIAEYKKSVK